jgi:PAS domain S-box-containing protein
MGKSPPVEATTRDSLELLFNISRELASALDLHSVLQRVLSLSMKNVGVDRGSIIVLDDAYHPVASAIMIGDRLIENTTQQLSWTLENGLAGWVLRNKQGVMIPDTRTDARWSNNPSTARVPDEINSVICVPLVARDQLVGVMTLVHPSANYFLLEQFALIQSIADQASIAILNGRLYDESRRQARVMTAVAESAAMITGTLDLEEVLQRIFEQISQALRVGIVSLALVDATGDQLTYVASTSSSTIPILGRQIKLGVGVAGWVAQEEQGLVLPETSRDPRLLFDKTERLNINLRSIACAPISSNGKVIGVLEAINPLEGSFDPAALQVLTGIGSLAGTAIRHAQLFNQLQNAHKRYHDLFEDSIDPILITDWKGLILEVNQQAELMTSLDRPALVGRSISELHTINTELLGREFEQLSSSVTTSYESSLTTQRGTQIPIQVYARAVVIDNTDYIQWILRDISERKNLDHLREDLIAMIYHDIRSPLANIVSSLDLFDAMLPADGDPSYRSLLSIALRSTERIQRLTNSLLDISRLESGQKIGNLFSTSPRLLARDAIDSVEHLAENKNQSIDITIPENVPYPQVEADMIRRVLINLLENSIKFTPPGGHITIGAEASGPWVMMWVQDDGPGIPPEDQERIFNKFTRLNVAEGTKGIGLGLAYCRLAIEAHGGRIWVVSKPGEGARFYFLLPST